jgi:hypothetical protein
VGADATVDTGTPPGDAAVDTSVTDGSADTGSPLRGTGTVSVTQTPLADGMATHAMTAAFAPTGGASFGCTTTEVSPCSIFECITEPPMDAGMPDAAVTDASLPTQPHAGTIDLGGALIPLSIVPGSDGVYPPATGSGFVFSGGETLNITAGGADVPAFAQSLTAPPPVTVTAPSFLAGSLTIDRATDFSFAWTVGGTAPDTVAVTLAAFELPPAGGSRSVTLTCTFAGMSLSGVVPASVLENLPAGATGSVAIDTRGSAGVTAGEWAVTVNASNGAVSDTGAAATTSATFP